MSLDSGDETAQIEICNDASEPHGEALQTEAKGSHRAEAKERGSSVTESPPHAQVASMETTKMNLEEIHPVTPVSTMCSAEGQKPNSVEQAPFSNFQAYSSQLNMSHRFSHFSVLTHQTFLGTTYRTSAAAHTQDGGSYFLSAYSQSVGTDKAAAAGWDAHCGPSRPHSKQK